MPPRNKLLNETLLLEWPMLADMRPRVASVGLIGLAGAFLLSIVACVGIDKVGERTQSVVGGSPSSVDSVVLVTGGPICSAVAVTTNLVLTGSHCIGEGDLKILVGANLQSPDASVDVTQVIEGPVVATLGSEVHAILLETEQELPLTPASLAGGLPALDDIMTIVGYDRGIRNQGDLRVSDVDGQLFTVAAEGGIIPCSLDAAIFDGQGNLVGIGLFGTLGTGIEDGCFQTLTSVAVSSIVDFLAESARVELPDDGMGENGRDDDGGCSMSNGVSSTWAALLVLVFLVWRRRKPTHLHHEP